MTSSDQPIDIPASARRPLLSVIILSFNTRNYLEQCLQSVAESRGFKTGEVEVVVIDNGSTDRSVEVVHKFISSLPSSRAEPRGPGWLARNDVVLVENSSNLGFAVGNNVGIRKAKGKYILLLNSDTSVYSDTLIKMVGFADGLPKLGAATCRIELPGGKIDPACHRGFPTPWNALTYISGLEKLFPKLKIFGDYHQGWKNYSASHEVDVISGAFFMVPRKVIDKVGLLDESFFMYGEDIDWCRRIKQAGFEIWYNPETKIVHYKKQSGRAKNREQRTENREQSVKSRADYHFVHTMEQFYRKHYMKKYPKLINWLVLAGVGLLKLLVGFRHSERSRGIQAAVGGRFKSLSLDPSAPLRCARDDVVKKVVIDARLAGLENAGIGRYVQSLVDRLEFNSRRGEGPEGLEGKEGKIDILSVKSGPRHYSLAEQLRFPVVFKNLRPDLVHFPHFNVPLLYNKPFVVTIHDLLWHDRVGFSATTLPKWLYLIKYLGYRVALRHAILKAKAVIVPSKWVKRKIVERFPEAEGKIKVIYEGVVRVFSSTGNKDYKSYTSYNFPYLIYVGSLYPHKNVGVLLNSIKHFDDLKLVVVCARSVFRHRFKIEIEKRDLSDKIIFAGFVPDEELAVLYKKAVAFVFPSLSEGFGLPGLEAMAAGCPVISSNAGALPEIYGGAAAYFDPKSETDLRREIEKVRENKKYREELIRSGKERAKKFTWEKCAEETLEVYQRVLK